MHDASMLIMLLFRKGFQPIKQCSVGWDIFLLALLGSILMTLYPNLYHASGGDTKMRQERHWSDTKGKEMIFNAIEIVSKFTQRCHRSIDENEFHNE